MLAALLALVAFGLPSPAAAAETRPPIVGRWIGKLDIQSITIRLRFDIAEESGTLSGTLVSIDQGNATVPATQMSFKDEALTMTFAPIQATLVGRYALATDMIDATWTQGPSEFPIQLTRSTEVDVRPQEPVEPLPYLVRPVTFPGGSDGVTLAATLTQPNGDGPFPAVVLLSGSGPQNRDEALFGHRPFLVLADALTRRGIVVLRFDDRGFGESTGNFADATIADFTADAASAFAFLTSQKSVDSARSGLIGHSEGALYATVLAANGPSPDRPDTPPAVPMPSSLPHPIAFAVLLAGPGVPMEQINEDQTRTVLQMEDLSDDEYKSSMAWRKRARELLLKVRTPGDEASLAFREVMKTVPKNDDEVAAYTAAAKAMETPYMLQLLQFDSGRYLPRVSIPTLVLIGEKDIQVKAEPNIAAFHAVADSTDAGPFTIEQLPNLNHLFQTAETGAISEYATIEETFAPVALKRIGDWILDTTND